MTRVVLAKAYRTPIGVFGGAFKDIPAYDLGATVIKHIVANTGIDTNEINEVIMGMSYKQAKDKILHVSLLLRVDYLKQRRHLH